MIIKEKFIHKFFLTIYMFLIIFAPPFFPKARIVFALITVILILCSEHKLNRLYKYVRNSGLIIFIIGISIFLVYIFWAMLINELIFQDTVQFSHYTGLYNRFIVSLLVIIPCSVYLNIKMEQYKFNIDDFWTVIFGAELIEIATVIISLLSPSAKSLFNHLALIMNGGALRENVWYVTVRSYGFSESLLDSFGLGAGLIAGLSFMYGVMKNKKYFVLSFVMLIASLVNARTGVIIYLLAVIIIFLNYIISRDIKNILKILFGVIIFALIGVKLWNILVEYYPATTGWISEGLGDLLGMLTGTKSVKKTTGFVNVVQSNSWWELPQFPRYIFGTGHSRYQAEGYTHTDFGYVNDIWAGGILGCIVLYGSAILFTLKQFKKMNKCYKVIMLYMLMAVLVYNIKSCIFTCSTGLTAYAIIVQYINFYYNYPKKITDNTKFV